MDNSAKFDKWNAVKKSIDTQNFKKQVEIQSIYWISIGQNVGSEVFGKGKDFARPDLSCHTELLLESEVSINLKSLS